MSSAALGEEWQIAPEIQQDKIPEYSERFLSQEIQKYWRRNEKPWRIKYRKN